MGKTVQISALVSEETKELMERYVRTHGVKKGFLIESALRHHLHALEEIPPDAIIPARIAVTRESGERILERIAQPSAPTAAMKELFEARRRDGHSDPGPSPGG